MKTEIRIPFGPQHPDLEEPINFTFEVEEEYVKKADVWPLNPSQRYLKF